MSIILSSPEMKKSITNMIIFNLAVSDFLISSVVDTFMIVGININLLHFFFKLKISAYSFFELK
jgi:hypothetical protein